MSEKNLKNIPPFYPSTLLEMVNALADSQPNLIGFIYKTPNGSNIDVTYSDFRRDVFSVSNYLCKANERKKIVIVGDNSYLWLVTFMAVTASGNIAVPVDSKASDDIASYIINDCGCEGIVVSDAYAAKFRGIISESGQKIKIYSMEALFEHIGAAADPDIEISALLDKNSLADIVYTSGTTGYPKGVMLSHGNITCDAYGSAITCHLYRGIVFLPLHHTFAIMCVFDMMLNYETVIFCGNSNELFDMMKEYRPKALPVVPMMLEVMYKRIMYGVKKQNKEADFQKRIKIGESMPESNADMRRQLFKEELEEYGGELSLMVCGGAPVSSIYLTAFEKMGVTVLQGYGITECSPVIAVNKNDDNVIGSVGKPIICNTVRIESESGETGEILVHGDNVMLGYYNKPKETADVIVDGWFKTGDIGRIDEEGNVYVIGRKKNLIICSNGENVSPEVHEEELKRLNPAIKEICLYQDGNLIIAEIFPESPSVHDKIRATVDKYNCTQTDYSRINKVIFRDIPFTKTSSNKIIRNINGGNNNG